MKRGFTLSEIMLVVTIIAILAVVTLLSFQKQAMRGFDSKRKTDLAYFKAIFEDYYNDRDCYPTRELWDAYNCTTKENGEFLAPYLNGKDLPCDPQNNERYLYIALPEATANACSGYKLFAALGNLADLDIPGSGCDPSPYKGCGYGPPDYPPPASFKYNYGISAGGTIINPTFDFDAPIPTPTPTVGAAQGKWVCTPKSIFCQDINIICQDLVEAAGCSTYSDSDICNGSFVPPAGCYGRKNICQEVENCE